MGRCRNGDALDRVLDAAARLFGGHRFHEVRMEDVAAQSGVAKGTLYRYFTDKDQLFIALIQRASDEFTCHCKAAAAVASDARARLVTLVKTIIAYFDDQPHMLELIQRAELQYGLGSTAVWQDARTELFRLVTDLFEEGNRRGEFVVRDPQMAMMLLLGGLRTIIRFGERPRPNGLAERVVKALLQEGRFHAGAQEALSSPVAAPRPEPAGDGTRAPSGDPAPLRPQAAPGDAHEPTALHAR